MVIIFSDILEYDTWYEAKASARLQLVWKLRNRLTSLPLIRV